MANPGNDTDSLNRAEADANGAFGLTGVGNTVQDCSSDQGPQVLAANKQHWIEIVMVDQESNPVTGEDFEIIVPDGRSVKGTLNSKGRARIEGIDAGNCQVRFPKLDTKAWKRG